MKGILMDAGAVGLGVASFTFHDALSNIFLALSIYLVYVRIKNAKKKKDE